jgi:hypothetical protein
MKATRTILLTLVLASAVLTACAGKTGTSGQAGGPTPDYCSPTNVKILARQINDLTQQFDDESALAATVPQSQLAPHIAALQAIRRAAQEQTVPGCVAQLKALQINQMNTVIATMLGFLGGGDQNTVGQGIGIARQQHDQYMLELARLLDVTPTIVTPPPTEPSTPTSEVTPTAAAAAQGTPPPPAGGSAIVAVNPGPYPINLRAVPSEGGRLVTTLDVGKSAVALAETTDGLWVQVLVPGHPDQKAWVSASDVQLVSGTPQ